MLLWVLILSLFGAIVALWHATASGALQANTLAVQARSRWRFSPSSSSPRTRSTGRPGAGRGAGSQPAAAGSRPRDPSAASLHRLCGLFDLVRLRLRGAHRRPHRRGLGALVRPWTLTAWAFLTLGIAMGSYWAYYELGWGGWWFWDPVENACFMPWLAGTALVHSTVGDGKTRFAEGLDDPAGYPHLLAVAARHLPGPLRRAHLGAFLRGRSRTRDLHLRHSRAVHRRLACALRVARADAAAGRRFRADLPRRRARPQQPVSRHRLRDGLHRHALPARARGDDRATRSRSARRSSTSPSCR